jgi:polyhydroxyalkanoate synthesis regulator phasin
MFRLLKKGYLVGLGLASLTREKIEEVVDELVRRGELAEKDRPGMIEDLMARMKEEQRKVTSSVRENAQKVITEMGVPSRQEYEELLRRIDQLEKAAHAHKKPAATHDPTA